MAAHHPAVAEARQSAGIPFSDQDGVQNPQATYTSHVVQDAMNLQIHLADPHGTHMAATRSLIADDVALKDGWLYKSKRTAVVAVLFDSGGGMV